MAMRLLLTIALVKQFTSSAAVSVAPLSFAPHVPLQPIRGDQKLQSVIDAEIKTHGFKRCTIMSGGIGL
eukprot:6244370-Amphidinium_carterae.1